MVRPRRFHLAISLALWSAVGGVSLFVEAARAPRAEPATVAAPPRAEVDAGRAVLVWQGEKVVGRIGREAVDASGVTGRNRVAEFAEAVADAGRRRVLFSVRYAAGGSPNGPVGLLQADLDGRNLATLYSGEGREARGLTLTSDGRLLAFVLTWQVSPCESLAWPILLDMDRPRDPEVWLPASLFLNEEQGEMPYFHEVRWHEDGTLVVANRPVTPSPECRRLPPREIAFDSRTRWFKGPVPPAVDLRVRVGRVLQEFLEAVAAGDLAAAHERLSPAAQRQMPMETFRERFRRRPQAFTNGVRADDNRVTFRFLTQNQETYYFYTLIPIGGAWRISAIRQRPTSSPWPD